MWKTAKTLGTSEQQPETAIIQKAPDKLPDHQPDHQRPSKISWKQQHHQKNIENIYITKRIRKTVRPSESCGK